jgi:hypothetical protein
VKYVKLPFARQKYAVRWSGMKATKKSHAAVVKMPSPKSSGCPARKGVDGSPSGSERPGTHDATTLAMTTASGHAAARREAAGVRPPT